MFPGRVDMKKFIKLREEVCKSGSYARKWCTYLSGQALGSGPTLKYIKTLCCTATRWERLKSGQRVAIRSRCEAGQFSKYFILNIQINFYEFYLDFFFLF